MEHHAHLVSGWVLLQLTLVLLLKVNACHVIRSVGNVRELLQPAQPVKSAKRVFQIVIAHKAYFYKKMENALIVIIKPKFNIRLVQEIDTVLPVNHEYQAAINVMFILGIQLKLINMAFQ